MAPPSTRLRLPLLNAAKISQRYAEDLYDYMTAQLKAVGIGIPPDETFKPTMAARMQALIRYAQTGQGDGLENTLKDLRAAWTSKAAASPEVDLVFLAAETRLLLKIEERVSVRGIGALADLSDAQVRNTLYHRKVKFRRNGIPAKIARAYLIERAAPGFQNEHAAA